MKSHTWMAALGVLAAATLVAAGCGGRGDGLSREQVQQSDRLGAIAKKTDGDWNKLEPGDREFLMGLSFGNEQSAKMLLLSASGKIGGRGRGGTGRPGGQGTAGGGSATR